MTPFLMSVLYVLVWRLSVLAVGLVVVVLGYRLFVKGLEAPPGAIEIGVGQNSVKLSNVTPGVFYALFGAAIIVTLIWSAPAAIVVPKDSLVEGKTLEMKGGIEVREGGSTVRGEE